jgi:hypothetical protein
MRTHTRDLNLQRLARDRLASGELLAAKSDLTQDCSGSGQPCALCGAPVLFEEVDCQMRDGMAARIVRFHIACHSAWATASAANAQKMAASALRRSMLASTIKAANTTRIAPDIAKRRADVSIRLNELLEECRGFHASGKVEAARQVFAEIERTEGYLTRLETLDSESAHAR